MNHKKESDWDGTLSMFDGFGSLSENDKKKARKYICSLIRSQRQSVRDEIVAICKEMHKTITITQATQMEPWGLGYATGFNRALKDLKERLTSKKEV